MSIKSWVLGRVQRMSGLVGRGDLPPRAASALEAGTGDATHPTHRSAGAPAADARLFNAEHLGVYGALIGAIRDELEHFVASHVRLHLAIAEHDRFLLTSIGVRCPDARELLQQFMHEFKPEQVRRYLAREVIGALPNAAAIDLSQFAGLFDADARDAADEAGEAGEYRELLEALRSAPASTAPRPYQVSLLGRWAELDAARPAAAAPGAPPVTPATPLAGQRCEFDIEDGDGRRRVVLHAVVRGRRYVIGKGEGCDIRVNGSYTSRRHAEIWLDHGAWWVADAGSTNGIRVESKVGTAEASERSGLVPGATLAPLELMEGARLVLSARAEGPASEYPSLALRPPANAAARITPIAAIAAVTASAAGAAPRTPLTAIQASSAPADNVYRLTAFLAAGVRTLELRPGALPVTVGRSRNQTLVVDRRHEGVSGHHLEIVELDASGAQVLVRGDNGVLIEGKAHAPGVRVAWKAGATMLLGASPQDDPACRLMLTRVDPASLE